MFAAETVPSFETSFFSRFLNSMAFWSFRSRFWLCVRLVPKRWAVHKSASQGAVHTSSSLMKPVHTVELLCLGTCAGIWVSLNSPDSGVFPRAWRAVWWEASGLSGTVSRAETVCVTFLVQHRYFNSVFRMPIPLPPTHIWLPTLCLRLDQDLPAAS